MFSILDMIAIGWYFVFHTNLLTCVLFLFFLLIVLAGFRLAVSLHMSVCLCHHISLFACSLCVCSGMLSWDQCIFVSLFLHTNTLLCCRRTVPVLLHCKHRCLSWHSPGDANLAGDGWLPISLRHPWRSMPGFCLWDHTQKLHPVLPGGQHCCCQRIGRWVQESVSQTVHLSNRWVGWLQHYVARTG